MSEHAEPREVDDWEPPTSYPPWIDPKWDPLPKSWPEDMLSRLRRNGVETWQQLRKLTLDEVYRWSGFGRQRIEALQDLLHYSGQAIERETVRGRALTSGPVMLMPVRIVVLEANIPRGVYFIRSGPYIKIGISGNVYRRAESFALTNPHEIVGLGWIQELDESAMCKLEAKLHEKFRAKRHRGEWFYEHQELLDFIKAEARPW